VRERLTGSRTGVSPSRWNDLIGAMKLPKSSRSCPRRVGDTGPGTVWFRSSQDHGDANGDIAKSTAIFAAGVAGFSGSAANYKRDVWEWADGIALGSGVLNGNPSPRMLSFLNSFDFQDSLTSKVGGAFAIGGSATAGLESVIESMNRGLRTFGVITTGGSNWRNAAGTGGVVCNCPDPLDNNTLGLARDQGTRIAQLAASVKAAPPGDLPPPNAGVTKVLNSVAESLGKARWTNDTRLHCTCEAYCRGWTAAVGCGTCLPSAFSFPGGDKMCVHPGPLGTGLLCRFNQTTLEPTGQSCCGVGGPCQLPTSDTEPPGPQDPNDKSLWPGACCAGGKCGNCPGGSPIADRFPQLNDTRTARTNRRYFDYASMQCRDGVAPN